MAGPNRDMALNLFSKNRGGDEGGSGFQPDPRKARRFFEHAETVADARNYDYAIECYVNGLKHDPDNLPKHEALRDVALRRKVAGGKPAPLTERLKPGGSTPLERMLHAEMLWAKDPLNLKLMLTAMQRAAEANEVEEANIGEVVYWIGGLVLEFNSQAAKPDKKAFIQARDLFAQVGAFDRAVEACKYAVRMDQNNTKLLQDLKDLEAERTMQKSGYGAGQKVEEGGFRNAVRDADKQRALEQDSAIHKTASVIDQTIARRRSELEEDPQDPAKLEKLAEALLQSNEAAAQEEALTLLNQAWDQSGQYRYKVRLGDIKIKQFNNQLRAAKAALDANASDPQARKALEEVLKNKLVFELQEFNERVKHYPTDMALRCELGKRYYQAKNFDEAIGSFQQAKADARQRVVAHQYLGSCYVAKGWFEEAIDTLRQGIEAHKVGDDRMGMDLRYLLMDALERAARKGNNAEQAREAQKIASQILQANINYRDIRDRMEKIRSLVDELQGASE